MGAFMGRNLFTVFACKNGLRSRSNWESAFVRSSHVMLGGSWFAKLKMCKYEIPSLFIFLLR